MSDSEVVRLRRGIQSLINYTSRVEFVCVFLPSPCYLIVNYIRTNLEELLRPEEVYRNNKN